VWSFLCVSGKYTAAHMMVTCRTEMPVNEEGVEVKHPGLALILQYKPNLELKDLNDCTPLVLAALAKTADKVKMLVCNVFLIYSVLYVCFIFLGEVYGNFAFLDEDGTKLLIYY